MSTNIDLKDIERKAFRSTYLDGLMDMNLGLIVICMALFIYRPPGGYSPWNIILMVLAFTAAQSLYQLGKHLITLPRLGQVRFGAIRKQKAKTLAVILAAFILLQVGLVILTALGGMNSLFSGFLPEGGSSLPLVAGIAALIVGISMIVIAFFLDFTRGYYIAVLMALAVFLMILLNRPVYPIMLGGLVFLVGLVIFVRFLRAYPLRREGTPDE